MTTYIENSNADWKLSRTDAFLIQVTPGAPQVWSVARGQTRREDHPRRQRTF